MKLIAPCTRSFHAGYSPIFLMNSAQSRPAIGRHARHHRPARAAGLDDHGPLSARCGAPAMAGTACRGSPASGGCRLVPRARPAAPDRVVVASRSRIPPAASRVQACAGRCPWCGTSGWGNTSVTVAGAGAPAGRCAVPGRSPRPTAGAGGAVVMAAAGGVVARKVGGGVAEVNDPPRTARNLSGWPPAAGAGNSGRY